MARGLVKTRVEVDVAGEQSAVGDVRKVRQELERTERQARSTETAAGRAEGRVTGILNRLRGRGSLTNSGIAFGSNLQLGAGGFTLRNHAMSGGGAGIAAIAAVQGINADLETFLAARQAIQDIKAGRLSTREAVGQLAFAAIDAVGTVTMSKYAFQSGMRTGHLINQVFGQTEAESQSRFEDFWRFRGLYGRHSADIERDRRNFNMYWRKAAEETEAARKASVEAKRREAIEAAYNRSLEAAEMAYERRMSGIKAIRNPLVLPEPIYQLQRQLYARTQDLERVRQRNEAAERRTQLLDQEGG